MDYYTVRCKLYLYMYIVQSRADSYFFLTPDFDIIYEVSRYDSKYLKMYQIVFIYYLSRCC